jgi:hypothetical protein
MTYAIPGDESEPLTGDHAVSQSGRLPELLVDVFDRWKSGDAEHASVNFGLGQQVPAEVIEDVFRAMRIVEART